MSIFLCLENGKSIESSQLPYTSRANLSSFEQGPNPLQITGKDAMHGGVGDMMSREGAFLHTNHKAYGDNSWLEPIYMSVWSTSVL